VSGFHATRLQRHSSPQLRNVCLFASMDIPLADPYNALVSISVRNSINNSSQHLSYL